MPTPPGNAIPLSQLYDEFNDANQSGPRNADIRDLIATISERQPKLVTFPMSPYQALETDGLIKVDATGGNVVIKLPAIAVMTKLDAIVKKLDATGNSVTIQPADADAAAGVTIDGGANVVINALNAVTRLIADAANWFTW